MDDYLQSMLKRKPLPAEAQFKHFIYGLKCYLNNLGYKELSGLVLPAIRRDKKLPQVMSTEDVRTLLHCCELYTKILFSIIYDCGLRAFEACDMKWTDIDIHRKMVHIKRGKGGKDRVVPISDKTLVVLKAYRQSYPSMNLVFKRFGTDGPVDNHFIRSRLREALRRAAITNSRIRNITPEGMVTYDWKDYRSGGKLEGDDHACQKVPASALYAHPASRTRADPPLWIALPIQPRKSATSTDPAWRDTCPQRAEEETLYADMRRERMEYRYMPEL